MRIVGGMLKGRRFSPPKNFRARPTTDTAKESLFNILSNFIDFEDIKVLDLFSGTGSISYEFASRGCKEITSVEKDFFHHKFICKCVDELKLRHVIKPVKQDVFTFLEKTETSSFDLIFADPPFNLPNLDMLPKIILESGLLKKEGYFIFEHGAGHDFSELAGFWQTRSYGSVRFSFFSGID
jgi:16S rRNA (guanine(966)-N(2))-methyltransferase RsmD